jgi:FAD/FMN-containing dehydrogenase
MMRPTDFRGAFRDDALARAVYAEGAGIARAMPRAVAVPVDADDVSALVTWAAGAGVPLVPRGSGSGMAGGAVGDGVVVDLSRLRGIGEVDTEAMRLHVGAGVLRGEADAAARRHGLRFPVNPSSGPFCTIGGMASTNAAGANSLRFGAMRAWVAAIDCVFADGTHATVGRGAPLPTECPPVRRFAQWVYPVIRSEPASTYAHPGVLKDSSGYAIAAYARSGELVDLLVGSEGTLALFTGLELALSPLPIATCSLLAAFTSLDAAVRGAQVAREHGATACELLDRTFLEFAGALGDGADGIPRGTESVLLIELEGEDPVEARAGALALQRLLLAEGASPVRVALDEATEEQLWSLRHAASPILSRLDPQLKSMQVIEDGAVPPERLPEYVQQLRASFDRHGIRGVIFGHAGDAHVHANALVDVLAPGWRSRLRALLDDVASLTARLGGTLAGEHGDGRLRTPLLDRVWSPQSVDLFGQVKRAFDPKGILNPGVKVPLDGQEPLGEIKYDPALPPLPPRAREALDAVERDRAWQRYRLALVE